MVIRWPTLRTSISERPRSSNVAPSGAVYSAVWIEFPDESLAALGDLLLRGRPSSGRASCGMPRPCPRHRRRRSNPRSPGSSSGPIPARRRQYAPGQTCRLSTSRRSALRCGGRYFGEKPVGRGLFAEIAGEFLRLFQPDALPVLQHDDKPCRPAPRSCAPPASSAPSSGTACSRKSRTQAITFSPRTGL